MYSDTTEITELSDERAVLYFDAGCSLCTWLAEHARTELARHRVRVAALQEPGVAQHLKVSAVALLDEMRVRLQDGTTMGGGEAVAWLAQFFWWGRPVHWIGKTATGRRWLDAGYRFVARHRSCAKQCAMERPRSVWTRYLPVVALPGVVFFAGAAWPAWLWMWALAASLFLGCKWLSLAQVRNASRLRRLIFLLCWPGMDARSFCLRTALPSQQAAWIPAVARVAFGACLIWLGARLLMPVHSLAAGWSGMIGMILLLHFGSFQLLAVFWTSRGFHAEPIMREPLRAQSLGEFWGSRWNRGFNDLATRNIFEPLRGRVGVRLATLGSFAASGLVHELVISVPARAGYGLPTLYFLVQGAALLFERSYLGRRLGLKSGWRGRVFALAIAGLPAFWLFHPPFVRVVILPFLEALRAI